MGLGEKLAILSILITIALAFIPSLFKSVRNTKLWRKKEIRCKLEPYNESGVKVIQDKSNYFIPIYGQFEAPHNTDKLFISDNRFLLTTKFIKEYLIPNTIGKKRYLILAGSGMGKSTFSADLFCQYINKYNPKNIPFPIHFLYLGDQDVVDRILDLSKKEEASESILILDALDENADATSDIFSFKDKLDEITNIFKFVIITSRTQLFPDDESEPTVGKTRQNSNQQKRLKYERIYVSPFAIGDIETYLDRKFSIGTDKYRKAIQIVKKGNDLMSRPMLLSFIDDLLEIRGVAKMSIAETYKIIIDQWLIRECKTQIDSEYKLNVSDFYTFSKKLAVYMYRKWEKSGSYHITRSEYEHFIETNGYSANPYSFRGRSLINRKSDGSIKFAHKSFWEFFIALDLLEHPGKTYSPCNLDMAKQFTDELNAIFLQGHNLDNIEHYEFNCSKFTKEDVQESLDLVKTLTAEDTLNPIQTIWCKLEDKIINLCLLNEVERDTTKVDVVKMLDDLLLTVNVDSVIRNLQDSFYLAQGDCQKQMDSLENAFTTIGEHFEENTYSNYLFPVGKKSQVVFSNILAYDIEKINDIISHDVLCIGTGFYNNQSIFDLITKILMSTSDIKLMTVVKDCISIIEAGEFLGTLAYTIQKLGTKSKCNIIICFNVDNTKITYVLNSYFWRKSKHINNQILTKMYMLKSGKSICSLPC